MATEMYLQSAGSAEHRFNYRGMHRYLIAMPTHRDRAVFTEDGRVLKVLDCLREAERGHHFDVYTYCFLPARLVLIVRGNTEGSDMKTFVKAFRTHAQDLLAAELGGSLWARKYTERVLRKTEEIRVVAQEVAGLVVKEGLAASPDDYPYLGSFVTNIAKRVRSLPAPGAHPARSGRPPRHPGRRRP